MNKAAVAIFVAVLAITLIEFSAAKGRDPHGRRRKNCTTDNDDEGANLRCAHKCFTSSNRSQWGNCQNGACACFARNPTNNTNTTTERRSVLVGVELPIAGDGKKHNILFG